MGFGFDFIKEGGTEALIRNIQNNPRIITNDPKFDVVVNDLFERVEAGDPKLLNWDDRFKNILGLYDQATQGRRKPLTISLILGNIESHLACKEPKTSGMFGRFMLGFKAFTNMDGLIETCRHAAHTQHWGKTPEQAREEFNERVVELYEANGESVPVPHKESMIKSKTVREGMASPDSGSSCYFSAQDQLDEPSATNGDGLLDPVAKEDGHRLGPGSRPDSDNWSSCSVTMTSEDNPGHDNSNCLRLGANNRLGSKATSGVIKAPARPNILSKEWWTPTRGLGVAAASGTGIALLAGGIYLFNKYFRKKKSGQGKRIHARSWNIDNPDFERF